VGEVTRAGSHAGAPDLATPLVPTGRPANRIGGVDGVRALAALAIVLTHTAYNSTAAAGRAGPWLSQLNSGVFVFFVISGFVLYRPFVAAHLTGRPTMGFRLYCERRVFRVYPAYWLALFVLVLVGQATFTNGRSEVANILLVQGYFPSATLQGIQQSWTLVIEVSFYLFLIFYAACIARLGRTHTRHVELAGILVLLAIGVAGQLWFAIGSPPTVVTVLPANLAAFGIGMLIALARAHVDSCSEPGPRWATVAGRSAGLSWLLALGCFVAVVEGLGVEARTSLGPWASFTRYFLFVLMGALLLLPFAFGTERGGIIRAAVSSRPIVFLGTISYGIYLWHFGIMKIIHDDWLDLGPAQGSFLVVTGLTLAVSIVVASLSWFLLERPLVRLTHARSRRLGRKATS